VGWSWCKFDVFTTSLSEKWIEMQIMLVKAVGLLALKKTVLTHVLAYPEK
jgi:hypothetical protein